MDKTICQPLLVPVHSNDLAWRMLEAEKVDLQKQIIIAQIDLPTLTGVPVHSSDLAWSMLEAEKVDLQKQNHNCTKRFAYLSWRTLHSNDLAWSMLAAARQVLGLSL
jgi:hypothetical protein